MIVGDNWSGGTFPKTITSENAYGYGAWLGARMRRRNNLLWCLGGDRMPIHKGVDYRDVWRRLAEGLAKGLSGQDLKYNENHDEWKKLMITYHACHEAETGLCSTFSYWTDEEAWISFIMLQSGHGLSVKNYDLVRREYERTNVMPVWDGEPAYEMMPTTWPVKDLDSFHGTRSVRTRAYCSLFAGAFGYTYGHASVWCMISEKERNAISRDTWYEALHSDGSRQIKILRDFLENFDLSECIPCQEILLRQNAEEDTLEKHEQACFDPRSKRLYVYFSGNTAEEIDLSALAIPAIPAGDASALENHSAPAGANSLSDDPAPAGDACAAIYGVWFNPEDGTVSEIFRPEVTDCRLSIANTRDGGGDQVLILACSPEALQFTSGCYGDGENVQEAKKVFEW